MLTTITGDHGIDLFIAMLVGILIGVLVEHHRLTRPRAR